MEKHINTQLVLKNPGECISQSQAQQFLALGDLMGWNSQLIGKAPMLEKPVRLKDWMLVPAQEDSSEIPQRTLRRIQTIYSQGLRPQGFVVVHEAPMQLTAPKPEPVSKSEIQRTPFDLSRGVEIFVRVLGTLLMGTALLPLGLLMVLDPIMVAVTEDRYWIEIDRWQA
jgi:hypothetical protein